MGVEGLNTQGVVTLCNNDNMCNGSMEIAYGVWGWMASLTNTNFCEVKDTSRLHRPLSAVIWMLQEENFMAIFQTIYLLVFSVAISKKDFTW